MSMEKRRSKLQQGQKPKEQHLHADSQRGVPNSAPKDVGTLSGGEHRLHTTGNTPGVAGKAGKLNTGLEKHRRRLARKKIKLNRS